MFDGKWQINEQPEDWNTNYHQRPKNSLLFAEWLAENARNRGHQNNQPNDSDKKDRLSIDLGSIQTEFIEKF